MVVVGDQIDIEIDRKNIYRRIGYSADCEPSARIASLIEEYVDNATQLIEPSCSYVIRGIERVQGFSVLIEDSIVFEGQVIAHLLEQCERVAVFLVTIGDRLEEMACQLSEDRFIVEAYVLDAIGSSAVEKLAECVQGRIGEVAHAHGLCISRRFSPGYCDWDISQQETLFRAMNGDQSGVRLSQEFLMTPQKSISGIIGIGSCNGNVEDYNPCRTCDRVHCLGRR
jgi:hypothetical protein